MGQKKISDTLIDLVHKFVPIYKTQEAALNQAYWLIELITKKNRTYLLINKNAEITSEQINELEVAVDKIIKQNMPIQYILQSVPFLDLNIDVRPPILIPRPETEHWVADLIKKYKILENKKLTILDLCTGTGCIALSFAHSFKDSTIYAIDTNSQACNLAKENSIKNNVANINILESDLYTNLPGNITFDFIVTNPPYISLDLWQKLDLSVKDWEDSVALVAEDDGMAIIKKIIACAPKWLKPNDEIYSNKLPQLAIEIGDIQGEQVKQYFLKAGFTNVEIHKDLNDQDRLVTGNYAL